MHYCATSVAVAHSQQVSLVREEKNMYDRNAIRVETKTGEEVGYVPRQFAPWIAQRKSSDEATIVKNPTGCYFVRVQCNGGDVSDNVHSM